MNVKYQHKKEQFTSTNTPIMYTSTLALTLRNNCIKIFLFIWSYFRSFHKKTSWCNFINIGIISSYQVRINLQFLNVFAFNITVLCHDYPAGDNGTDATYVESDLHPPVVMLIHVASTSPPWQPEVVDGYTEKQNVMISYYIFISCSYLTGELN